ncbi:hypothetical protein ASG43_20785 [Aureimonas sp. Leaf454]|nr:hypothetical protein ASG43_20785 [Aureimonas sp. Leaf454]
MRVCTTVSGKTASIASGKPVDDGDRDIGQPLLCSSFMARSQNAAPSLRSIQIPRISLSSFGRMPSAM